MPTAIAIKMLFKDKVFNWNFLLLLFELVIFPQFGQKAESSGNSFPQFLHFIVRNTSPLPLKRIKSYSIVWYTKIRNVEPVCHSSHLLRPSHCPDCRNEQRRKPHVSVSIKFSPLTTSGITVRSKWGPYTIHPMRRFRCFVFDNP